MATLTDATVASTYNLLLKVKTSVIGGSVATIQDGLANDSALMLSTGAVKIMRGDTTSATLEVTGATTLTGVLSADGGMDGVLGGAGATPAAITGTVITADTNFAGDITGDVTGDLTGNVTATSVLVDGVTATTQTAGDKDTKVATTAYADSAGRVLQVVYAQTSIPGTEKTSETLTKFASLTADITPTRDDSAILIQVMISGGPQSGNVPIFGLKRGDEDIGSSDSATGVQRDGITSSGNSDSNDSIYSTYLQYADTPATTDETTYTATVSCRTGKSFYLNRTYNNSNDQFTAKAISTITLTEISQ